MRVSRLGCDGEAAPGSAVSSVRVLWQEGRAVPVEPQPQAQSTVWGWGVTGAGFPA